MNKKISYSKANNWKQRLFIVTSYIFCISIVLFPLFDTYALPFYPDISFAEALVFLLAVFGFIVTLLIRPKMHFPPYAAFLIYSLLLSSIMVLFVFKDSSAAMIRRSIRDIFFFIIFALLVPTYANIKRIYKFYKIVALIACLLIFAECISYYCFSKVTLFLLPFLPLNYAASSYSILYSLRSVGSFRPESLFLEPSYFAYYIIPFLVLSLFSKEKGKWFWVLLVSFTLLLTKSGTGYVLWVISCFLFFVFGMKARAKTKLWVCLVAIIAGSSIIYLTRNLSFSLYSRIKEIFVSNRTSGGYRVMRGFSLFTYLPLQYKIFGIGNGSILQFITENGLLPIFGSSCSDFVNSFTYILISYGAIGFLGFLFSIFQERKEGESKLFFSLLIIFLLLCLADDILLNAFGLLYLCFLFSKKRNFSEKFYFCKRKKLCL